MASDDITFKDVEMIRQAANELDYQNQKHYSPRDGPRLGIESLRRRAENARSVADKIERRLKI